MELLRNSAEKFGISLNEIQLGQFEKYMKLLLEENEKMNLTAITEKDEILIKHFLDSMTLLLSEKIEEGASVIDIGAGAGFPSLPVKIARPDLKVTMLDSLNKRVGFLNMVVSELGLKDISAVHMRAEDGGRT
ncbi:MAG: 16S rRNA (guanine(527)-N(7))-methyltransferase RsmG, partial [Clostridia bacterium]